MSITSTVRRAGASLLSGSLGLAALLAAASANAAVIDFDNLRYEGSSFSSYASVDSGGFQFTNSFGGSGAFLVWDTAHNSNANPGGATLSHNYGGSTTTMSQIGGSTFSLLSIDFGDVYNQAGNVETIQIVGTRSDLSTVIETVTTDALAGLETFAFSSFVDLISVEWTPISGTRNTYLQLDNIVVNEMVSSVPEPMSLSLFAGGLAALALTRRGSRRAA
jgi:hypothetical protein